ncbi:MULTISPECIES: helix-turn-helix domain-containing protein [Desulfofundulus]|uniref:DNA-binding transcriptional regulator, XRE-family HTH domain n=1 Tax=Desulfofundulus thermosubterraneus DSM 16057 TaxID=1121432 RepID=A0A1M6L004_9FIRM|nr:helix-turn-helix transcriptional regulator [Desulfofundulus thermosubterraneus]SHJ64555.1 DNA-binding transcriptional regulator, XRE-family HTH domain [Desulfofundulus thermosubterraneus DSM 16057]
MFSKEVFGQRLRQLRQESKLSLEQLGKKIGVAKQTVGHWETGYRLPPLDVAVVLADFFDVSLDYLVGRSDDPRRH